MKKELLIIIIFLFGFQINSYSQVLVNKTSDIDSLIVYNKSFFSQSPLSKFVGEWDYNNGNDSLKIILKQYNISNIYSNLPNQDVIIGYHRYIKNKVVLEDFINPYVSNNISNNFSIGGVLKLDDTSTLVATINDKTDRKYLNMIIKIHDTNENLECKLFSSDVIVGDYKIHLPETFQLKRFISLK